MTGRSGGRWANSARYAASVWTMARGIAVVPGAGGRGDELGGGEAVQLLAGPRGADARGELEDRGRGSSCRISRRRPRRRWARARHPASCLPLTLDVRRGGERGIRTLETVPRLHTFQACAFDHSATSPAGDRNHGKGRRASPCLPCGTLRRGAAGTVPRAERILSKRLGGRVRALHIACTSHAHSMHETLVRCARRSGRCGNAPGAPGAGEARRPGHGVRRIVPRAEHLARRARRSRRRRNESVPGGPGDRESTPFWVG